MVTTRILQSFINILQTVEYHAAKWRNNGMNVRMILRTVDSQC